MIPQALSVVFYLSLLLVPAVSSADTVVPIDAVRTAVNVREDVIPDAEIVGKLRPGDTAELLGSVPWWSACGSTTAPRVLFRSGGPVLLPRRQAQTSLSWSSRTQTPDHWKGLVRLLDLDGRARSPHTALEFWEPGYDRGCNQLFSYESFIEEIEDISDIAVRRPLEETHAPSTATGAITPFTLGSLPGVTFTVLHNSDSPPASNGECTYRINNASIVLMLQINGIRVLFTGDANGKERDHEAEGNVGHIESSFWTWRRLIPEPSRRMW